MDLKKLRYFVTASALCFIACAGATQVAAQESVSVPLNSTNIEGGAAAPATMEVVDVDYQGKNQQGIKLVMQHRVAYNSIRIPVDEVNGQQFNTLQFKVRFNTADGDPKSFGLWILNKNRGWAATSFLKHAKKLDNGWYQFSWDMINQPDNRIIDMTTLTQIQIRYGFRGVPEGKTDTLTVVDMNFVSGQSVRTGDPELFAKWRQFVQNYQPDYSDSTKYLAPPLTGRLSTPLPLAKNGAARAQIVVPQNASAPLTLAGTELRHWLGEITGAEYSGSEVAGGIKILLGRSFATGQFDDDLKWLDGSDGFAVRSRGNNIYIFGATDKGTLNGVFAFLENNSDIIWPRPRPELGAVFTKNPDLKVAWADAREKPATRLRGWGTNLGLRPEHEIWSVRNRLNYPKGGGGVKQDADRRAAHGDYVEFGGGHNISGFIGKTDRFYPIIDGKKPEKFNIWRHQPNFTEPGIVDEVAKNVLEFIKERAPDSISTININIEDNWGLSTDPQSLAPIKLADGTMLTKDDGAFRSTQYFQFLNAVTKKINAVHPDMMVGTYAYFFTATAPKIEVDPHIRVYFAPYVRKDQRSPMSAPINDHWWRQLTAWSKKSSNIVIREYYGIMNGFRPLAETVGFDVNSYLTHGIREYTAELNPDESILSGRVLRGGGDEWDMMAMDFWVISRLYWDASQNVEELRKYYLRRTFHEAAPAMEKFYGTIRTTWYDEFATSDFESPERLMQRLVVAPKSETALLGYLQEAAKSAKNPVSQLSVDVTRRRFEQWLTWAKDPARKKVDLEITPAFALQYGWGSNNDWGKNTAWASSTYLLENDKSIPVVRVTVRGDRMDVAKPETNIVNSFLNGLKEDAVLSFRVRSAASDAKPLELRLQAEDTTGARYNAPDSAFEKQADGSIRVIWKLQSEPNAPKPFDLAKLKKVTLTFSGAALVEKSETIYYLTNFKIE